MTSFQSSKTFKVMMTGALAGGISLAASAGTMGDKSDLKKWQHKASAQLSEVMEGKSYRPNAEPEGNLVYEATITADGGVEDLDRIYRASNYQANMAGKRLLKNLELPDLPEQYAEIRIRLVLQYGVNEATQLDMKRFNQLRATVSTRELSENDQGSLGISVISTTNR